MLLRLDQQIGLRGRTKQATRQELEEATSPAERMFGVTAGVQHGGALPALPDDGAAPPPLPSSLAPLAPPDLLSEAVDSEVQRLQDAFATTGLPDGSPPFAPFAAPGRTHMLTASLAHQPAGTSGLCALLPPAGNYELLLFSDLLVFATQIPITGWYRYHGCLALRGEPRLSVALARHRPGSLLVLRGDAGVEESAGSSPEARYLQPTLADFTVFRAPTPEEAAQWAASLVGCLAALVGEGVPTALGRIAPAQLLKVQMGEVCSTDDGGGSFVVFPVQCSRRAERACDDKCTTRKRYSDFAGLHDALASTCPDVVLPPLPPSTLMKHLDEAFIAERRQQLDEYMADIALVADATVQGMLASFGGLNTSQAVARRESGAVAQTWVAATDIAMQSVAAVLANATGWAAEPEEPTPAPEHEEVQPEHPGKIAPELEPESEPEPGSELKMVPQPEKHPEPEQPEQPDPEPVPEPEPEPMTALAPEPKPALEPVLAPVPASPQTDDDSDEAFDSCEEGERS